MLPGNLHEGGEKIRGGGGYWMGVDGGKIDHWLWWCTGGGCEGGVKMDVCHNVSVSVRESVCVRVVMSVFPPWWRAGVKVCGSAPLRSQRGWGHAGNSVRGDKAPNER